MPAPAPPSPPTEDRQSVASPAPARPRVNAVWIGGALAVLAAAALLIGIRSSRNSAVDLNPRRVAVAPFRNATGEAALDPIGSMSADWITRGLTEAGLVEVVPILASLGSARRAAPAGDGDTAAAPPIHSLAHGTGAGTIIYGAYYRNGDDLLIQAQIVDVRSGTVLHAIEPVRAPIATPLPAIQQIRRLTLAGLAPILDSRMSATAAQSSTPPSYAAYRDYADGLDHFIAGDFSAARTRFEKAAAADSSYTLPVLFAALSSWNMGERLHGDSLARELERSRVPLARLDRAILQSVLAWGRGDWAAAYRAAREAATFSPGSSMALNQVAVEALRLNRPREARDLLLRLDPDRGELRGSVFYWQNLGEALHLLGNHRDEMKAAENARRRHPDDPVSGLIAVRALAALGKRTQLDSALEQIRESPSTARYAGVLMREAAQELAVHGDLSGSKAVALRAEAWYRGRLAAEPSNTRLRAGLARALLLFSDDRSTQALAELAAVPEQLRHGRSAYWKAAEVGKRGDCGAAISLMRAAVNAGQEYGMEIHAAPELQPVRRCAQWASFAARRE